MPNKHLVTLISLLFFTFSFSQQKDTIYGKVKSVAEHLYCKDNNLLKPNKELGCSNTSTFIPLRYLQSVWLNKPTYTSLKYFKEFNEKGKITQEIWIDRCNDTLYLNYEYDKDLNIIQKKKIYWDGESSTTNFNYIKNKIKTRINYSSFDPTSFYYHEYVYDSILNLNRINRFNDFGQTESTIYKYDKLRNKIKEIVHRPLVYIKNGKATRGKRDSIGLYKLSKKHIYNDNNLLIETSNYDAFSFDNDKSKLTSKVIYEYSDGLVNKIYSITDSINNIRELTYDAKGRIIKSSFTLPKFPSDNNSTKYYYNKAENIKKLIYEDKDGSVKFEFTYLLDSHNNWIKITKSINGKELYVLTREIEYLE
jgi:hypothetical protein